MEIQCNRDGDISGTGMENPDQLSEFGGTEFVKLVSLSSFTKRFWRSAIDDMELRVLLLTEGSTSACSSFAMKHE